MPLEYEYKYKIFKMTLFYFIYIQCNTFCVKRLLLHIYCRPAVVWFILTLSHVNVTYP